MASPADTAAGVTMSDDTGDNPLAERSLLGALILWPQGLTVVMTMLGPDDFASRPNRLVFDAMMSLFDQGDGIDLVTITTHLRKTGDLDAVGGPLYVAALLDGVPRRSFIHGQAEVIRDRGLRRRLRKLG